MHGDLRSHAEDTEVVSLLRQYDRTVARLAELGIDVAKLRPWAREQPVLDAVYRVLDRWTELVLNDENEAAFDQVADAMGDLCGALHKRRRS